MGDEPLHPAHIGGLRFQRFVPDPHPPPHLLNNRRFARVNRADQMPLVLDAGTPRTCRRRLNIIQHLTADANRMHRIRALFCLSHLWLSLGLVLFLFSHGRVTIPVCSWFAFVFLIRFHRTSSRPWLTIVTLWVGMSTCHAFMYDGFLPVRGLLFYAACLLFGGIWAFPFIIDRLLYRRLDGLASILLWPLLMVTINFFLAAYLPSLAHSQIESLSLIQIVSLTGMGGPVFLSTGLREH